MIDLKVKLGDRFCLKNPIMTASGTCGYGNDLNDIIDINKYGALVTKSLSLKPRKGNPPPRIVETPSGMINSIGLANIGVESFLKEKKVPLKKYQGKLIVNIAGKTEQEFIEVTNILDKEKWIDGYEINVSCPNVKQGGIAFGTDPEVLYRLSKKIRGLTDKFLIIKLSPNVTDIRELAGRAQEAGADAVSLVNTFYGAAIDIHSWKPKINSVIGGLSGPAIKPAALAKVIKANEVLDIPIIGIGGIATGEDVIEYMLAGATAVELGTVHFFNPAAVKEILEYLEHYGRQHNIRNLQEIIGEAKI